MGRCLLKSVKKTSTKQVVILKVLRLKCARLNNSCDVLRAVCDSLAQIGGRGSTKVSLALLSLKLAALVFLRSTFM